MEVEEVDGIFNTLFQDLAVELKAEDASGENAGKRALHP
jgi:hypothetical protein